MVLYIFDRKKKFLLEITSYENYCPTDFSAPIFTKYFWNFCKAHASGIDVSTASITGIPIAATFSPSPSPKSNVTQAHSYFPSQAYTLGYDGIWLALFSSSLFVLLAGLAIF